MRIVITENGERFINQLQETLKFKDARSRSSSNSKTKRSRVKNLSKSQISPSIHGSAELSSRHLEQTNAKQLNIAAKKIMIPKTIIERYNADKSIKDDISILPNITLPEQKSSNLEKTNKDSFKVRDLIPSKVINDMRKDIKKREYEKNLMFVMHEDNFRTKNQEIKNNKIEEGLNKELKVDSSNLIAYINSKTTISDLFIKNMASYDDNRIKNLNKACQKILNSQQQEIVFKEHVKDYLKKEKVKEAEEYKNKLNSIEKNMFSMKNYIEKNKITYNHMDRYEDIHRDIVKGWDQQKLDRYYHKIDNKLNSSLNSSMNNTAIHVNNSMDSIKSLNR